MKIKRIIMLNFKRFNDLTIDLSEKNYGSLPFGVG